MVWGKKDERGQTASLTDAALVCCGGGGNEELPGRSPHLSVVDNQLEEGVHQQDLIGQDAAAVQENGLQRADTNKQITKGKHHQRAPAAASWRVRC